MNGFLVPLLLVHGLAHLVGFVGPWRLMDPEGVTYQSSLFNGRVHVEERTMRALGIGWLMLACAFFAVAVAAMVGAAWWSGAAVAAILASLLMCAASWPAARIGMWVNLALLMGLLISRYFLWP